jgi:hypothetical protein
MDVVVVTAADVITVVIIAVDVVQELLAGRKEVLILHRVQGPHLFPH